MAHRIIFLGLLMVLSWVTPALPSVAVYDCNPQVGPFFWRGYELVREKKFDLALGEFNRAIEIDPNCAPVYANRALAHAGRQDVDKAWEDLHAAKRLHGDIRYILPKVSAMTGTMDFPLLEKRDELIFYQERGSFYRETGQSAKASADFNKADELKRESGLLV